MGQCTVQCARLNNAIYRHWSCGARSCVSPPKYARLSSKGAATQVVVTVDCFHTVTVWSDHVTPNATRRKTKERSPLRHSRPRGGRGGDAYRDGVSQHALDRQRLRQRRRLANSQRPRRTQTRARQKATIKTRQNGRLSLSTGRKQRFFRATRVRVGQYAQHISTGDDEGGMWLWACW